jgi:putative phage-type endonuclease
VVVTVATNLVPSPEQTRVDVGIGASSAAAAVGVSDHRTRLDAWLEATGRIAGFEGNERTRWGQVLEPVIRAHYVERNGATVHVPPTSMFHAEHAFIRATPDGIVLDPMTNAPMYVGPQVKNVGLRMAPAWADGAIPIDYAIQGVVEMAVTVLPRIDFAVLIGGQEYREVTMWRDAELEADCIDQLVDFWRLVETNTQPEIDASRAFRSHALKQIKRKATVMASPVSLADLERWREVAILAKRLKAEEATLKNRVVAELAAVNANRMTSPLGDVSIGNPAKKTSWKEVAHDLRPLVTSLDLVERELRELGFELADDRQDHPLLRRVESLRAQIKLVNTLTSYEAVVAKHTTIGDPRVNRPREWTKDVGDADEEF